MLDGRVLEGGVLKGRMEVLSDAGMLSEDVTDGGVLGSGYCEALKGEQGSPLVIFC